MKKHELTAAIAAAEAELARLLAVTPEHELHPMTLPLERVPLHGSFAFLAGLSANNTCQTTDSRCSGCDKLWKAGNYYADAKQAAAYNDAFETMRLMRRQPGIVDPSKVEHWWVAVDGGDVSYKLSVQSVMAHHVHMFPAYESQQAAAAAVAAVGEEQLVRCAKWLAGVVK